MLIKRLGNNYSRSKGWTVYLDFIRKKVWVEPKPLFLFGRYRKLKRFVYQSREALSVQGILKSAVEELTGGTAVLHASGREDWDARMLGNGRPFVLRILNWRKIPDLFIFARRINAQGIIEVKDLTWVGHGAVELVANSHFIKRYHAGVMCPDGYGDLSVLRQLVGEVSQRTPRRVMRRRADLIRQKRVLDIKMTPIDDNRFHMWVITEPGLYIKELISGDGGRTQPSVSSLLETSCLCYFLDVIGMDDRILDFLLRTPIKGYEHTTRQSN